MMDDTCTCGHVAWACHKRNAAKYCGLRLVSRALYESSVESRDAYRQRWLDALEDLDRAKAALDRIAQDTYVVDHRAVARQALRATSSSLASAVSRAAGAALVTLRAHLEAIRVELVCAYHSPDARSREPDLGAAHRAVCAALAILNEAPRIGQEDFEWSDSEDTA